jgi:17beta-estradiol 17-dehydrogenase / very-long-chain 3-oxoacyl-CoA reductase
MDQISYYLSPKGLEENKVVGYILYLSLSIGLLSLTRWTFSQLSFIYRHTLKRQQNFTRNYNQGDSWAVVTGGSDGIGEQFCYDLAKQGFNICIIARNEEKMKAKLA